MSVTVLAIIGIVIASLSLICVPFQLIGAFISAPGGGGNPAMSTPALAAWTIGSSVVGVLMSVALLIGCIGSLKLAAWGRKLMLAVAAISLVVTVVSVVVNALLVMPALMNSPEMAQLPEEQRRIATFIGGSFGVCCGLIFGALYPIFVLVFFNKADVKLAFSGMPAVMASPYMPPMPPPPPAAPTEPSGPGTPPPPPPPQA
jgi:hypothetical protein